MIVNQKHIKVPCGGWILEREVDAHIKRCEMCEAMLDYRQKKLKYITNIVIIIIAMIAISGIIYFW